MPRFLFYVPPVKRPTGGVGVIVEWVKLLRSAGIEAELINDQPDYTYSFSDAPVRVLYSDEVRQAFMAHLPVAQRLRKFRRNFPASGKPRNLTLQPDDVIMVPEWAAGWLPKGFPHHRHVLLVQVHVWFIDAAMRRSWNQADFDVAICTSDLCAQVAEMAGMPDVRQVPLAIDTSLFKPLAKRDVIAFMPRKRADEVEAVTRALRARGHVADYEYRPIDGLPVTEVARILGESRIFLSFSEREGFGLPPAEAMACGCHVVGYTGAGGDEFFDPDWCYPISDGNLPQFVRQVEEVARLCRDEPEVMAVRSARAAQEIARRYDRKTRDEKVLSLFRTLSEDWRSPPKNTA